MKCSKHDNDHNYSISHLFTDRPCEVCGEIKPARYASDIYGELALTCDDCLSNTGRCEVCTGMISSKLKHGVEVKTKKRTIEKVTYTIPMDYFFAVLEENGVTSLGKGALHKGTRTLYRRDYDNWGSTIYKHEACNIIKKELGIEEDVVLEYSKPKKKLKTDSIITLTCEYEVG